MTLEERIKNLVVTQLGVDAGKVTNSSSFIDDLGADSLDTVELVMAFEEEFDMEIADEDAQKMRTVQDVIDFLKDKVKPYAVPKWVEFRDELPMTVVMKLFKKKLREEELAKLES